MTHSEDKLPADQYEGKLLDHDYDGIQELDNPLPRWWVILFYLTILFSIAYVLHFTFGPGLSIEESLAKKMAAIEKANTSAPGKTSPVAFVACPENIAEGQTLYISKCAACHGQKGEGLIGPNLTDNYWVNGDGSSADIYAVIDKGIPAKGMIAWGPLLQPSEMAALVVYIQSLKGTNPPNPKAPEGTLIE